MHDDQVNEHRTACMMTRSEQYMTARKMTRSGQHRTARMVTRSGQHRAACRVTTNQDNEQKTASIVTKTKHTGHRKNYIGQHIQYGDQRGNLSKLYVDVTLTRVDVYRFFQNRQTLTLESVSFKS